MHSSLQTRGSLLGRLQDSPGDDATWAEFVRVYGEHVVRWTRQYGLQDSDAADVAQDVLVRFWRHAASFRYDPTRRFRSYLRRIVFSALATQAQRRTESTLATSDDVQAVFDSVPAREDLVARIEAAYDLELLTLAMREVEARVQPHTWAAFRMLALEHRSGAETAEALGMPASHAYVARRNVQRMIREAVQRLEGGLPSDDDAISVEASP